MKEGSVQLPARVGRAVGHCLDDATSPDGLLARITVDPGVCGGRPCIRGLRMRVSDVLDLLASGMDTEEILAEYPYVEREDVTAALVFAARSLDQPAPLGS